MIKIRLMRIGTKKRPFYRVVALDERSKRTGAYIESLGTYNPLTEPKEIKLNNDRIDYWIKKGAQPSNGYLRMIGKAPQRPPRKPKKEQKEGGTQPSEIGAPQQAETPTETPAEQSPAEQADVPAQATENSTEQPTEQPATENQEPQAETPTKQPSEETQVAKETEKTEPKDEEK